LLGARRRFANEVFGQVQRLVRAQAPGRKAPAFDWEPAIAPRLPFADTGLLSHYLQILLAYSEVLQQLVREDALFQSLAKGEQEAVLRRVDTTFTILIHRELQAFSENYQDQLDALYQPLSFSGTPCAPQARSA
jgi:hypothetical protein